MGRVDGVDRVRYKSRSRGDRMVECECPGTKQAAWKDRRRRWTDAVLDQERGSVGC